MDGLGRDAILTASAQVGDRTTNLSRVIERALVAVHPPTLTWAPNCAIWPTVRRTTEEGSRIQLLSLPET